VERQVVLAGATVGGISPAYNNHDSDLLRCCEQTFEASSNVSKQGWSARSGARRPCQHSSPIHEFSSIQRCTSSQAKIRGHELDSHGDFYFLLRSASGALRSRDRGAPQEEEL